MTDSQHSTKRKRDAPNDTVIEKKRKAKNKVIPITTPSSSSSAELDTSTSTTNAGQKHVKSDGSESKVKRRKLVPPRPFPTVARSDSATGPRSAHKEGKNVFCITRKTPLGAYMRRCKDIVIKDGFKTLHLSAMGAAIPHLLRLVMALPPVLPFSPDEIHTTTTTGTVTVQDEIVPDDEDEDITYQTRAKSSLMVVLKIGDGEPDATTTTSKKEKTNATTRPIYGRKGAASSETSSQIVFKEPEQQ